MTSFDGKDLRSFQRWSEKELERNIGQMTAKIAELRAALPDGTNPVPGHTAGDRRAQALSTGRG